MNEAEEVIKNLINKTPEERRQDAAREADKFYCGFGENYK